MAGLPASTGAPFNQANFNFVDQPGMFVHGTDFTPTAPCRLAGRSGLTPRTRAPATIGRLPVEAGHVHSRRVLFGPTPSKKSMSTGN